MPIDCPIPGTSYCLLPVAYCLLSIAYCPPYTTTEPAEAVEGMGDADSDAAEDDAQRTRGDASGSVQRMRRGLSRSAPSAQEECHATATGIV